MLLPVGGGTRRHSAEDKSAGIHWHERQWEADVRSGFEADTNILVTAEQM